jgi:putative OPT family oligopeptide transporter
MTICALLLAGGVLFACGVRGQLAILATLGVAGIVCCAACTSGDIAQDLKTGLIVGATPARQQWTEILAAVIAAGVFAPVMALLHGAFVIGSDELLAPQATLFASLTRGIFGDGDLPIGMIKWGLGIGVAIIILDGFLERADSQFRLHVMPVAVGIYLPFAMGTAILIGGLIRFAASRAKSKRDAADSTDSGLLFGSGLIAGESFMGIGLAVLAWRKIELWQPGGHWLVSLAAFGALVVVYATLAMRKTRP